nr:GLIPR1 protein 1 [Hymenolepis microstoma]
MKNCISISALLMGIVLAVKLSEAQSYFGTCNCCQYCNSGSGVSNGVRSSNVWGTWSRNGNSDFWGSSDIGDRSGSGSRISYSSRSGWNGNDDLGDSGSVRRRGNSDESAVRGGSGSRVSGGGGGDAVPNAEMQKVLDKHNELRRNLAKGLVPEQPASAPMPDLVWDSDLATKAQAWANKCTFNHDLKPNRVTAKFKKVGQNIVASGSLERNLEMWINEHVDYDYRTNTCAARKDCEHYTQMVWAGSTHLGCGKNMCRYKGSKVVYLVCNYGPASCKMLSFHNQLAILEGSMSRVVLGINVLPELNVISDEVVTKGQI